jgi:glycine/D-amino acid oxidase-like deaminating enzyme
MARMVLMVGLNTAEMGCYTDHGVSGYGIAVRLSRQTAMSDRTVRGIAEEIMLSIAAKCTELGARAIGHIKSHVRTAAGTIKADTIGVPHGAYSNGFLEYPVKDLYMTINSIVQGIPEAAVKAATLEGVYAIAEQKGILVVKEKEHTFFDAFDAEIEAHDFIQPLEEQCDSDVYEEDY